MLLTAEERHRIQQVSLVSRRRIITNFGGRHASTRKGESLDFADFRPYVPGDDYRRIDHALFARLGQLVVREFEAEDELTMRVVIDVSGSMGMYGKDLAARRLAATVAYLVLAGGDRVSLYALPGSDRPLATGPSGHSLSAWPLLENWLDTVAVGGTAPLAPVLRNLVGVGGHRRSTVIVSDMLDPEWERALDGMGVGAGGLVVQLLAREELEPDLSGDLALIDTETGEETFISTSEDTRRTYRHTLDEFVTGVARRARRAGLDYLLVPAVDDAPLRALAALASSGRVR